MKRLFLAVLALATVCLHGVAAAEDWKEIKGDHFIVFYVADENFSRETLRRAETYYTRIANDLGYNRFSFWSWDNRVKIYIYADEDGYRKGTGQPEWSKGVANYNTKSISTFNFNREFQETLLPHEIAHLIFRDFVGFKGQVPLWLDEGVAQWQEPQAREMARRAGYTVIVKAGAYPFDYFTAVYDLSGKSEQEVQFFYMQAVSVIDYLVKSYGNGLFTELCRQLREGKSLDEALKTTYGNSVSSLLDLEQKWIRYVNPNLS